MLGRYLSSSEGDVLGGGVYGQGMGEDRGV